MSDKAKNINEGIVAILLLVLQNLDKDSNEFKAINFVASVLDSADLNAEEAKRLIQKLRSR